MFDMRGFDGKYTRAKTYLCSGICLILLLFVLGCTKESWHKFVHGKPERIATSHLAVLSVGEWSKYKKALKPTYRLSSQAALKEILPITTRMRLAKLRSTGFGLKLAATLDATSGKSTTTSTTSTGPSGTVQSESTEETSETVFGPGDPDKAPSGESAPKMAEIAALLEKVADTAIDSDPLLRYLTATALYQEVQMLERYLDDVPQAGGYKAYIVRMQLSLMPTTRNQSYDAYADISFFLGSNVGLNFTYPKPPKGDSSRPKADPCMDDIEKLLKEGPKGLSFVDLLANGLDPKKWKAFLTSLDKKHKHTECIEKWVNDKKYVELMKKLLPRTAENLKVIPLVITDNLEAAFGQQSRDKQTRVALGLLAAIGRVGGSVDFETINRVLREFAGMEYNSLFTVGRLSGNTLRVRLGAPKVGDDEYAMMTRTHQITVLLLVPNNAFSSTEDGKPGIADITVASKTFFIDAKYGESTTVGSQGRALALGQEILKKWAENTGRELAEQATNTWETLLHQLLDSIDGNNFKKFETTLSDKTTPKVENAELLFAHSLWMDLLEVRAGSRYTADTFRVTKISHSLKYDPGQTALVYDYPQAGVAKVVVQATDVPSRIRACITSVAKLKGCEEGSFEGKDLKWLASSHSFSPSSKTLTLVFPSLKKWCVGLRPKAKLYIQPAGKSACVYKWWKSCKGVSLVAKSSPPPEAFKVSANYKRLVVDRDHSAQIALTVKIEKKGATLALAVENARFGTMAETSVVRFKKGDPRLYVIKDGTATVKLVDIVPHSLVTIHRKQVLVTDGKEKVESVGKPLTFIPLPPPPPKKR